MANRFLCVLNALVLLGSAARGKAEAPAAGPCVFAQDGACRDGISVTMFRLYDKYSKDAQSRGEANSVRGFKAAPRGSHGKQLFQFNFSSIQTSEMILSSSFHFLQKRQGQHPRPWRFRTPRHLSGGPHARRPLSSQLLFYGSSSDSPLGNITLGFPPKGSWQAIDVTAVVKLARKDKENLIAVEFEDSWMQHMDSDPATLPYILVYADDRAIEEPNSVAKSLQRYGPFPSGESASPSTSAPRTRRELQFQIRTNNVPEAHFNTYKNHQLWQNTYFPTKVRAEVKTGRKRGQPSTEGTRKTQVLSFDERTMKKARRRQWSEPRVCSRRYLRVDFADIGWSEWVLAPKSFDAYYCAGACGFPMPKMVHPSNHATIQSIVRAVGIVPGVPEPCCVPDKMSPLPVLYLDPDRNMVLKVYPGMSVDTCACR